MAMAVRLSGPRAHALAALRAPLLLRTHHFSRILVPQRPRWKRTLYSQSPPWNSRSRALPVVSAMQDTILKSQGSAEFGLAGEALEFPRRSHECGELSEKDVGQRVCLCGWVASQRSHGTVVFVNLRDHSGIVQVRIVG